MNKPGSRAFAEKGFPCRPRDAARACRGRHLALTALWHFADSGHTDDLAERGQIGIDAPEALRTATAKAEGDDLIEHQKRADLARYLPQRLQIGLVGRRGSASDRPARRRAPCHARVSD